MLSCDPTARRWLGIDQRPDSRRLGEYLSRFNQVGTAGWQDQLDEDVAPLLPNGTPVWMAMANAYYHKEVIHYCQDKGWDYPVNLTDSRTRRPVLEQIEDLGDEHWQDIGKDASAILGVDRWLTWNIAKSAHGPWRLSASPALYRALPNRYFRNLGLPELAAR